MVRKLSVKRRTFKKSLNKRYKRTKGYKRTKKNTLKRRVYKKIRKNTLKRRVSKRNTLRRKSFRGGRPRALSSLEQLKEEIRTLDGDIRKLDGDIRKLEEGLQKVINSYNFPKVVPDDVQDEIKRTYSLERNLPKVRQETLMSAVISRIEKLLPGKLVRNYNVAQVNTMITRIEEIFERAIDAIHFMLTICPYIDDDYRKGYSQKGRLKQYCHYNEQDFNAFKSVIITDINRVLSEKKQEKDVATRLAAEKQAKAARLAEQQAEAERLAKQQAARQQAERQLPQDAAAPAPLPPPKVAAPEAAAPPRRPVEPVEPARTPPAGPAAQTPAAEQEQEEAAAAPREVAAPKGVFTTELLPNELTELLNKTVMMMGEELPQGKQHETLYILHVLNDKENWRNLRSVDYVSIIIEYFIYDNNKTYRILFPYITKIENITNSSSYKGEKGCKRGFSSRVSSRASSNRETCRQDRVDGFEKQILDDESAEKLAKELYFHSKRN